MHFQLSKNRLIELISQAVQLFEYSEQDVHGNRQLSQARLFCEIYFVKGHERTHKPLCKNVELVQVEQPREVH
jgi:hypothetical protein